MGTSAVNERNSLLMTHKTQKNILEKEEIFYNKI